uniref:NADH-ubiquinone oxidoreductase chain 6 n=1 Tax=Allopsontus sp. 1 JZ-2014 TaxID=1529456 RepID=A0A0B4N530_9INSE|nr:NADH dehydrogenase subunit 6 [Allopsontus sp. 1 JZ-2014]
MKLPPDISFLLATMIFINIIMVSLTHPVAMGLTLMIQTTLVALLLGNIYMSFWFSYVLFLIFLGGLLVLFIYVASLASNEMFSLSTKSSFLLWFLIPLVILTTMDLLITPYKIFSKDSSPLLSEMNNFLLNSLTKFYSSLISSATVMLILYLLLALIAVVKITKMNRGPLRTQLK